MNLTHQAHSNRPEANAQQAARRRYGIAFLAGCFVIINCTLAYLLQPAKYQSDFALVLPGTNSSARVALEDVGQVSQSSNATLAKSLFSPLSNYKQILQGENVRQAAADITGSQKSALQPKVRVLQQTSIIEVKTRAGSAEAAQAQAWALYQAFEKELTRLRQDEIAKHDDSAKAALQIHEQRMVETREKILAFQQRSLLVATSQVDQMAATLARFRENLAIAKSEARSQEQFLQRLSLDLGVSPSLAGSALTLQSDAQFAGFMTELDQAAAQLSRYTSQWGEQHPRVVAEKQRFNRVIASLAQRSEELVGLSSAQVLYSMNLGGSTQTAELFSQLLDSAADLQASEARIDQLQREVLHMDDQLRVYTREASELERLEREHQRAEAIYNAAAARFEAGRIDSFASYPIAQLLEKPHKPERAVGPRLAIGLGIGVFSLLAFTTLLVTLWHRQRIVTALLKRS